MKEGFVSWRGGIGLSTRAPCWSAAHGGGDNFFRMTDDGFHSQMPLLFVLGLPRGSPYPSLLSLLLWQPADISDERHSSHRDTESQTWKNERGSISVQCRSREKPMLERGTRWFVEIRDHKQVQVKPLCSFFLVQLALICKKWVLHAWTFQKHFQQHIFWNLLNNQSQVLVCTQDKITAFVVVQIPTWTFVWLMSAVWPVIARQNLAGRKSVQMVWSIKCVTLEWQTFFPTDSRRWLLWTMTTSFHK